MKRSFYLLVTAGTLLIACCYGFARFAYGLFTPVLSDEFALTPATVGAIGSGSYVGYCLAIVASTVLTERFGARRVALAAGVVATAGIAAIAAASSTAVLAAGVLVAGSSTGLASPPLAAAVARWVREDARDRAQTVVNAGTGVGVVLSAPIALLLFGQWRVAWAVMAVITAAATVLVARAIPAGDGTTGRSVPRAAWRAGSAGLVAASLLTGFGSAAVWTFGRELAGGLGDTAAVLVWTVLGAAGIAGAFGGDLVQRIGLGRAWRLLTVAMAGATLVYAVCAEIGPAVGAAGALFGATYIALSGLLLLWATRVYPDGVSFGVALSFFALAAGQALGAPAVGVLAENAGLPAAFVVAAGVGVVALLVRPARSPAPDLVD
ncbi:arabinose ABC transporter permease [Mycobacterium sp. 852013-51886_SCH5428379]|uniref:MFS transporter n=1 Tax=Mycobacterium sp. 852013-51886_SCH5428379 TaxID=1834111 RepID=UPI0007FD48D2|nr:MFS transporter [Mycobacterium sp. 852013-51886_SCH5428379]OBB61180.1 arabinose ABC transporter permease [Mycobacterium sp. 852013-51886_SCH5428379]